ncbi:MAG: hypothetical protein NW224_11745 [Leptolyngbyaceae cyanobacterium bins.302]|nr:hypothetical protein [Leptolyngbyaceae cyanobacterium bins.302]
MFRASRDDDQMLMVFFGTRNGVEDNSGFASAFVGVLALAIVMMVFVGLLNESEQRRLRQYTPQPVFYPEQSSPVYPQRNFRRVYSPYQYEHEVY